MDDISLLNQKIEFLEIQLKEFQQREQFAKSHFESVINSVLAVTSPSITQEFALKIEEIKKNHSNELLILKFFYKQRVDILQEKVAKLKNGENKELARLKSEKQLSELSIKELSFENQQLKVEKQFLEGKLESFGKINEEMEKIKERLNLKKESWKVKKAAIKEENIKNRENMEKNVEQLKVLYQSNMSDTNNKTTKVLEDLIEKLKSYLTEFVKRNLKTENLGDFKYFMYEIDTKLLRVLENIERIEKDESQAESFVLTVKNKDCVSDDKGKVFSFTSPQTTKNNENLEVFSESIKKFTFNNSPKPPVHSFTHKRARTSTNINTGPFIFQYPDRHSLQETAESIATKPEPNKLTLESLLVHLKIQLAKVKNQRDKSKVENDKILLELKDSKFKLASEKEKISEKLIKVENEAKKISSIVKSMPQGLENFQREISRSVYIISRVIS